MRSASLPPSQQGSLLPAPLSPSYAPVTHSSQPSMHLRTPAPSFMNRAPPAFHKPNPAVLNSDAPPHLLYAPPQARGQLPNSSSWKGNGTLQQKAQLGRELPTTSNSKGNDSLQQKASMANGWAAAPVSGTNQQDSLNVLQQPKDVVMQVPRDAFPKAFGSSNKAGSVHWHSTAAALRPEMGQPRSQPSGVQSQAALPTVAKTASSSQASSERLAVGKSMHQHFSSLITWLWSSALQTVGAVSSHCGDQLV